MIIKSIIKKEKENEHLNKRFVLMFVDFFLQTKAEKKRYVLHAYTHTHATNADDHTSHADRNRTLDI